MTGKATARMVAAECGISTRTARFLCAVLEPATVIEWVTVCKRKDLHDRFAMRPELDAILEREHWPWKMSTCESCGEPATVCADGSTWCLECDEAGRHFEDEDGY